jgi:folate-binding protein YgfZ
MRSGHPSPLHDVQAAAGASFEERQGRTVVASYGDPADEYTAALEGSGLVDLAERAVLEVSGPKRLEFLQGMLSNDVAARRPGQGCRAAIMNAKGHLRFLVRALVEEDVVRLEAAEDRLDLLQRMLEHHRVAAPVRFAESPSAVVGLMGMGATALLQTQGLEPPLGPEDHARASLGGRDVLVARAGDLPGGGFALHVLRDDATAVWEALVGAGARPVGRDALDARRVEDLRPWYGFDVTEDNLLHETGLLAECHSPTKGCYVGQEVIARLEARGGHVNKALRRLRLGAPSRAGAGVRAADREVGRLTTAASSPRYGPIAMAFVHRSHFAPGTELDVEGAPATVVAALDEG